MRQMGCEQYVNILCIPNIRAVISTMMNIMYKRHFGITLVNVSFFKTAASDVT